MHFKILLKFILVFISFIVYVEASDIPEPLGYVSDYVNVIDSESKQKIASIISELEQKTSAEIAVVTVKNIDSTIEDYGVRLFEKFGIGKKDKNNGVLIVSAVENRKVRIEVGYGLEGILPDGKCGEILDKYVIPYFKQGDYSKGLLIGVSVIAEIIAKDRNVELTGVIVPAPVDLKSKKIAALVFPILFPLLFWIIFLTRTGRRRGYGNNWLGGFGGAGSGSGSGGFSGFGGGFSGGGGASRGW